MLIVHQVRVGGYDNNFGYLIYDSESKEGAVIDPCGDIEKVFSILKKENVKLKYILITHSHHDHLEKIETVKKKYNPLIVAYSNSPVEKDVSVKNKDILKLGDVELNILYTPGHRFDSICILSEGNLFTGDTLFVNHVGRVDFEGGNVKEMFETLQILKKLPDETKIYSGHDYGDIPVSTIGREKEKNRYLIPKKLEDFEKVRLKVL